MGVVVEVALSSLELASISALEMVRGGRHKNCLHRNGEGGGGGQILGMSDTFCTPMTVSESKTSTSSDSLNGPTYAHTGSRSACLLSSNQGEVSKSIPPPPPAA